LLLIAIGKHINYLSTSGNARDFKVMYSMAIVHRPQEGTPANPVPKKNESRTIKSAYKIWIIVFLNIKSNK
jgi:hypothetical protein